MKIEVWSDIMCPFCYIGKRKLEAALADFEGKDDVHIVWRSFQLNPNLKTDPSQNPVEHLAKSKGWSMDYTRQAHAHVAGMAREVGLDFQMEKAVVANSYNAHRLIQLAKTEGKEGAVAEKLFQAYFTEGKNVDDKAVLAGVAGEAGMDIAQTEAMLNSSAFSEQVDRDLADARYLEISGVPFFLFEEKYAISGAQPVELFKKTLSKVWAETQC